MDNENPTSVLFQGERILEKKCNEMIGICKGLIADGTVNQREAVFLLNWLESNSQIAESYPGNILAQRLTGFLADGVFDLEEEQEIIAMLQDLTGEKGQQGCGGVTSSLGFDDPMPELRFEGFCVCLTGTFQSGERKNIAKKLENLGAEVKSSVPKRCPCFLIVGSLVSEAWKYSTYGNKLKMAIELRDEGYDVWIVSEDHLWNELQRQGLL